MSEMSFEDAVAELDAAVAQDAGTPAPTPAPVEQATPAPVPTPEGETPAPQVQPDFNRDELGRFARFEPETPAVEETVDTFDGGKFNPDQLPEELRPGWNQLQAAFTQKTQELAEQRKMFEGVDLAEARQAYDFYQQLQDPQYLVQFHGELSQALEAQGLTPAQANAEAARQLGTTAPAVEQAGDALAALRSDPELAPVAEMVGGLQSQLQQMQQQMAQAEAMRAQEQMELAVAGEMLRQESLLREAGMKDEHINAVKQLAPSFDGSLLEAAEAFKSIREQTLTEWLESKQTVEAGVGPVQNPQTVSEIPTQIEDLDTALKAAQGALAEQGITDLL